MQRSYNNIDIEHVVMCFHQMSNYRLREKKVREDNLIFSKNLDRYFGLEYLLDCRQIDTPHQGVSRQ